MKLETRRKISRSTVFYAVPVVISLIAFIVVLFVIESTVRPLTRPEGWVFAIGHGVITYLIIFKSDRLVSRGRS